MWAMPLSDRVCPACPACPAWGQPFYKLRRSPKFELRQNTFVESNSQEGASTSSPDYEYTYKGSDGRLKATFEQAFKSQTIKILEGTYAAAPWSVGYQISEAGLLWNDDLKTRLLTRAVANSLSLSEEEVAVRLQKLQLLLPSLGQKMVGMKPQILERLASNIPGVVAALLQLKTIFPEADVSKLAVREPALVLGFDMDRLQAIADELRQLLPRLNVDRLVEENPSMLDVEGFKLAMQEARRIMPSLDVQQALGSDPLMIFGFQRGSQLIPYDEPRPLNEEERREEERQRQVQQGQQQQQRDDDEYGAYYTW